MFLILNIHLPHKYEELEKCLLVCCPLEMALCERVLVLLRDKNGVKNVENRYTVLILQIFYLVLRSHEIFLVIPKFNPSLTLKTRKKYEIEKEKSIELIFKSLLIISSGKLDERIEGLITHIICILEKQKDYNIILQLYLFLNENTSKEFLNEMGLNQNFLKCFLKPLFLLSNTYL